MLLRNRLPVGQPQGAASIALAVALAAIAMLAGGCFEFEIPAPSATVSPMTSVIRPAKGPNCPLQVLRTMPAADVQQLALVDTWGDQSSNDADLLPVLKSKACEVGADAVVIVTEWTQFRALDNRLNVPEGIIEIERYGADIFQHPLKGTIVCRASSWSSGTKTIPPGRCAPGFC